MRFFLKLSLTKVRPLARMMRWQLGFVRLRVCRRTAVLAVASERVTCRLPAVSAGHNWRVCGVWYMWYIMNMLSLLSPVPSLPLSPCQLAVPRWQSVCRLVERRAEATALSWEKTVTITTNPILYRPDFLLSFYAIRLKSEKYWEDRREASFNLSQSSVLNQGAESLL